MAFPMLAIESGFAFTWAALGRASGQIFEMNLCLERSHNEGLAELVHNLLLRNNLDPALVRGLVLGAGPGSFTGLRIGFSFMQGFAAARRVPLITLPSLRACAYPFCGEYRLIAVAMDARRSQAFCALYSSNNHRLQVCFENLIMRAQELWSKIEEQLRSLKVRPHELLVVSDLDLHPPWREAERREPRALAASLINMATALNFPRFSVEALAVLRPNYVRSVSAKTIKERCRDVFEAKTGE